MINGSDLLTPSQMQQAHTLEFIQTVENEIRKGNDNFFMIGTKHTLRGCKLV